MTPPTPASDAALLLVWARQVQRANPEQAELFRRCAKRIAPDVQLGDVVTDDSDYSFNGVRRTNPFAR